MATLFDTTPVGYMICRREACGKLVGFVRTTGDNRIVVTDNPYDYAKKYVSEVGAKTAQYELNSRPYSTGNWEVVKVYV